MKLFSNKFQRYLLNLPIVGILKYFNYDLNIDNNNVHLFRTDRSFFYSTQSQMFGGIEYRQDATISIYK
jgi:hypothetical protein